MLTNIVQDLAIVKRLLCIHTHPVNPDPNLSWDLTLPC